MNEAWLNLFSLAHTPRLCLSCYHRNQLCINTAIVYMHRFYCVHSFKTFHRHVRHQTCQWSSLTFALPPLQLLATAALFLAAKNEEQPRKLQYVAQASYACAYKDQPMLDIQSQVTVM